MLVSDLIFDINSNFERSMKNASRVVFVVTQEESVASPNAFTLNRKAPFALVKGKCSRAHIFNALLLLPRNGAASSNAFAPNKKKTHDSR